MFDFVPKIVYLFVVIGGIDASCVLELKPNIIDLQIFVNDILAHVTAENKTITLEEDERITLKCPPHVVDMILIPQRVDAKDSVHFECVNDTWTSRDTYLEVLDYLKCVPFEYSVGYKTTFTGEYCDNDTGLVLATYLDQISDPLKMSCFHHDKKYTSWTIHLSQPSVETYVFDVNECLTWNNHYMDHVNLDHLYFEQSPYIERGQLVPMLDFNTTDKEEANCYYVNTAPQVSAFKKGNWLTLEKLIKNQLVNRLNVTLAVVTGILYTDDNWLSSDVQLPDLFWKVISCDDPKYNFAFVGVNNICQDFPDSKMLQICGDDICDDFFDAVGHKEEKFKWYRAGKIYCCHHDPFFDYLHKNGVYP